jgi:hypothetical protein
MQQNKVGQAVDRVFEVVSGALIGVDIIALIQFVSLPALTVQLTVALYCFTVSIPLLAFFVFSILVEKTRNCSLDIWYKQFALVSGMLGSLVGIGAILFHLSETAGAVFMVLCVIAIVLTNIHIYFADKYKQHD